MGYRTKVQFTEPADRPPQDEYPTPRKARPSDKPAEKPSAPAKKEGEDK